MIWKGKQLQELSREELIAALEHLGGAYHELKRQVLETIDSMPQNATPPRAGDKAEIVETWERIGDEIYQSRDGRVINHWPVGQAPIYFVRQLAEKEWREYLKGRLRGLTEQYEYRDT